MGDMAQWTLEVPVELDEDVRELVAEGRAGTQDFATFVREAVENAVYDRMLSENHARNAGLTEEEVMELAVEAVRAVRRERAHTT